MRHDLTDAESAALAAINRGLRTCDCDALACAVGATTGAGALASIGRLIRCGLVRAIEDPGHALPRFELTVNGVHALALAELAPAPGRRMALEAAR